MIYSSDSINYSCPNFQIYKLYFFTQLGYLLAVPRTAEMEEEKDFEIEGLEFVVWWLRLSLNSRSEIHQFFS